MWIFMMLIRIYEAAGLGCDLNQSMQHIQQPGGFFRPLDIAVNSSRSLWQVLPEANMPPT
jgi:hypothetical protein